MRAAGIIVVGLFLTFLSGQVSAATSQRPADCVAHARDKPTLDASRLSNVQFRMVNDVIGWERDGSGKQVELTLRHGEETAQLKNEVALRIEQGGCETYSNQYEFSFSRPSQNADGSYWLRKASDLLLEVAPANVDEHFRLQDLAEVLSRQAKNQRVTRTFLKEGLEGKLESGLLGPEYVVEVERRSTKAVLKVTYSIPL